LDFDDALNTEAAEQHRDSKVGLITHLQRDISVTKKGRIYTKKK
jgi:hypothetical protein